MQPEPRIISPRRRKLRATWAVIIIALVLGVSFGAVAWWRNRPAQYAPGEASADVTSELAKALPAHAPKPVFVNVTATSGLAEFRNFNGPRSSQLPEDMGPGLAWGDFDNDGDDDLFLVSAGGALTLPPEQLLPCALYENLGDGRFSIFNRFPELKIWGMGAAWGDYDADGFLDLAVSGYNAIRLFRNTPAATGREFLPVASFPNPPGFWTGLSWGDYDRDHDLDLYVCGYVRYQASAADVDRASQQLGQFVPYTLNPASFQPAENMLLRNDGADHFIDVAPELGVTNPTGRSLSALWHDFDDDGWPDLYVANDVSDNVFFHNEHGSFKDISHPAWVADYRSAMGLAAGDYNRDGDDDLFITHWVAQENALYENHWADFKRAATNAIRLRFTDVNEMRGLGQLSLPFVGWGTEFADFDQDGWLDIFVANGNTLEQPGPRPKQLKPQESFLLWNNRGEHFHDVAFLSALLSEKHSSRGLAISDYDNDGDLDVALAQLGEGVQLLRNDTVGGHWLKLTLRNGHPRSDRHGFADQARVVAHVGPDRHRRTISSASYLSQSSRFIHLGLGNAETVDLIEVFWPDGATARLTNLAANVAYEYHQGSPSARAVLHIPARIELTRQQTIEFWDRQRAAMNALKVDKDLDRATSLFRAALRIDPRHEDSRYYLAQCLAAQSDLSSALDQLAALKRINPQSHRAFQQWGNLRALSAASENDLAEAAASLEQAHAINPEETGALLILAEVCLMRGDLRRAATHLEAVCRTNPRAAGAFFLRGYLARHSGDHSGAVALLQQTRAALGPEWQPKGTTAEGDVKVKQHAERSPLSRFWENWDGATDPAGAYQPLQKFLQPRFVKS